LCLYQLVKNFEYKKADERGPLHEAMNLLLPQLYQLIVRILPDASDQSVLLQKEGLKIYFALTQYMLPLDLITKEAFAQWMEVCRQVRKNWVEKMYAESGVVWCFSRGFTDFCWVGKG
jgi:hypothetical protein